MTKDQIKTIKKINDIDDILKVSLKKLGFNFAFKEKKEKTYSYYSDRELKAKSNSTYDTFTNSTQFDKLYFLLGLKPVLRMETNTSYNTQKTQNELLAGINGLGYEEYKHFTFVSYRPQLALLGKELTRLTTEEYMLDEKLSDEYNYVFGKLYGYPDCCSRNFPKINMRNESREYEIWLDTKFSYKNLDLFLHYYPCSIECKETKKIKNFIIKRLDELEIF